MGNDMRFEKMIQMLDRICMAMFKPDANAMCRAYERLSDIAFRFRRVEIMGEEK